MRFNIQTPEACDAMNRDKPRIGDVYFAKGGRGPRIHIIIGQSDLSSYFVGLGSDGSVQSAGSYYTSVFEARQRVGHVEGLEELEFNITWELP